MTVEQPERGAQSVDINDEMEQAFIDYAVSVIVARALPDVRDGLKPVQRRIIYSMFESNIGPTTPHRKCSKVVGDVMGNLSSRRGQILGTESANGGGTIVRGHAPQAELHLYATDLNSMTHGRGTFTRRFHGYEQMPPEAAHKVIEDSAKEKKEEVEEE